MFILAGLADKGLLNWDAKGKKKKKEAISKHPGAQIRQSNHNHEDTDKKQTLPVRLIAGPSTS